MGCCVLLSCKVEDLSGGSVVSVKVVKVANASQLVMPSCKVE